MNHGRRLGHGVTAVTQVAVLLDPTNVQGTRREIPSGEGYANRKGS
jgi:hypothetical protein